MNRFLRPSLVIALFLALVLPIPTLTAQSVDVMFGPGGGFDETNRSRTVTLPNGKTGPATMGNGLLELLNEVQPGGRVKICMYSMSDMEALDALIAVARDKNIEVKLLLDAAAEWSKPARDKILDRIRTAAKSATAEKRPFPFQMKIVTAQSMGDRGRVSTLDTGKVIFGTMHEKFGVFYQPGNPVPLDSFCGSSNMSYTSDQIYAEHRVFFRGKPAVARQLQEEFARLWNEYGTPAFGRCTSEPFIDVDPVAGDAVLVFNSEPVDETALTRIDEALMRMLRQVDPATGTIDLAMFSFTRRDLAEEMLRLAERFPDIRVRVLLDHAQIDDVDPTMGKQGPWFERELERRGLKNIEVRYRWRFAAYGLDAQTGRIGIVSFLSLFLHHKVLVVNRNLMAMGSYNWSQSAEDINFESLLVLDGRFPGYQKPIDAFGREFDALWQAHLPKLPIPSPRKGEAQTVSGAEGRAWHAKIVTLLQEPPNRTVLQALDRGAFLTFDQLLEKTGLPRSELRLRLDRLVDHRLVCRWTKDGVDGFAQAD